MYALAIKPTVYILAVVHPQPAELWDRLRTQFDAPGSPHIRFEHEDRTVRFTADTRDLLLRSRVADALMAVCGHGEWTRAFRPVE